MVDEMLLKSYSAVAVGTLKSITQQDMARMFCFGTVGTKMGIRTLRGRTAVDLCQ